VASRELLQLLLHDEQFSWNNFTSMSTQPLLAAPESGSKKQPFRPWFVLLVLQRFK
jgi:hypothetical protein